ncbi:exosporium glycoprotein BclB-related protein [Fictibacillus enclensis]|uniref:exosporium glycoprotein BclB-related protein n=1 Tax=Fictibacillus enclensis TaxID=1017270 RepID=UPI0025A14C05|nr:exosporium glycoprotein BclB-related protein [Fictibacillus enclensis]MDM5339748.1 exosporium glycoprotein BclB-related protein [Fictibacillus enclensis]
MTSIADGSVNTAGLIGFGSSIDGVSIIGATITLGGVGGVFDFAFVVPRDGIVTSISAFFSATVGVIISEDVTVRAQLWTSTTGGIADPNSSTFTPIAGAFVDLVPDYDPLVVLGDNAFNTASPISIPVSTGDKLIMVFSLVGSDSILSLDSLTGFASAGIVIS